MRAAAPEADTGASAAEGLIDTPSAQTAAGRSGCHRPGKGTIAAGLIEVKAVRVYDQRFEGRGQGAIRAIWPLWSRTSPGRSSAAAASSEQPVIGGPCRRRGSSAARSRGCRSHHAASAVAGRPPGAGIPRAPTADMGGRGHAGADGIHLSLRRKEPQAGAQVLIAARRRFWELVTLAAGSHEPACSSADLMRECADDRAR